MGAWRFAAPFDPGWTWDRRNPYVAVTGEPDSRIDYTLLGPPLPSGRLPTVTSVKVMGAEPWDGTFASDHFAVTVDIEVPPVKG